MPDLRRHGARSLSVARSGLHGCALVAGVCRSWVLAELSDGPRAALGRAWYAVRRYLDEPLMSPGCALALSLAVIATCLWYLFGGRDWIRAYVF